MALKQLQMVTWEKIQTQVEVTLQTVQAGHKGGLADCCSQQRDRQDSSQGGEGNR